MQHLHRLRVRHHCGRGLLFAALLTLANLMVSPLPAQSTAAQPDLRSFDIPAGAAEDTLPIFSRQSGRGLLVASEILQGVRTLAVKGDYAPPAALELLLTDTGLVSSLDEHSGAFAIHRPVADVPPGMTASQTDSSGPVRIDDFEVRAARLRSNPLVPVERDGALPFEIVTRVDIERSGALNLSEYLLRLPSNFSFGGPAEQYQFGGNSAQFMGEPTSINLRGFGGADTLVLINGRRAAEAPMQVQNSINNIPLQQIERIEVLPAASAAIYGANAAAGAINIVLKRGFTGSEVTLYYGNTTDKDAGVVRAGFATGFSSADGRTQLTLRGQVETQNGMIGADRGLPDLRRDAILEKNPALLFGGAIRFSAVPANIYSANGANFPGTNTNIATVPEGYDGVNRGLAPYIAAGTLGKLNLDTAYNSTFGGATLLRPDFSRTRGIVFDGTHQLHPNLLLTFDGSYNDTFVDATEQRQRSQIFTGVSASHPHNPFGVAVIVAVNPLDLGPWVKLSHSDNLRYAAGFETSWRTWRFTADYNYAKSTMDNLGTNADGGAILGTFSNTDPARVYNPFADFRTQSPNNTELLGNLNFEGKFDAFFRTQSGVFRGRGEVYELASGAITSGLGYDHRRETREFISSNRISGGAPIQNAARTINGTRMQDSVFGSLNIPLFGGGRQALLLRQLDLNVVYRHERATAFGVAESTNYSLLWKPFTELTIRSSLGEGYRPPSIDQLVPNTPDNISYFILDPKRGSAIDWGNPASWTTPTRTGGNPGLKPELTENFNLGVIYQPNWAKGLRLNVEFFRLEKTDAIGTIRAQQLVDNEDLFPGRIVRGPLPPGDPYAVGPITLIDATMINLNKRIVHGFDLSLGYETVTPIGNLSVQGAGTLTKSSRVQLDYNLPFVEQVGKPIDGGPITFTGRLNAFISKGPWDYGVNFNYIDSYIVTTDPGLVQVGGTSVNYSVVTDVQVAYRFPQQSTEGPGRWLRGTRVMVGANNVFDKDAPFSPLLLDGAQITMHDMRQRFVYVQLTREF